MLVQIFVPIIFLLIHSVTLSSGQEDLSTTGNEPEKNSIIDQYNQTSTQTMESPCKSRTPLIILIVVLSALLVILLIGNATILLIRYVRQSRGSYSTRQSKNPSTTVPSNETSKTPAFLYTPSKPSPPSTVVNHSIINDGHVQLLPQSTGRKSLHVDGIEEDESFYAVLGAPNEK